MRLNNALFISVIAYSPSAIIASRMHSRHHHIARRAMNHHVCVAATHESVRSGATLTLDNIKPVGTYSVSATSLSKTTLTPEKPVPTATFGNTTPSYIAIVNQWRSKLGLTTFSCDPQLQYNALDTVVSSNGAMIHKLNSGTFAQVLAPGNSNNFEHVFVGGWLCELPSFPGLEGVCETQSRGWAYNGQTGHAEILISDNYSRIGCALHAGMWSCDLA